MSSTQTAAKDKKSFGKCVITLYITSKYVQRTCDLRRRVRGKANKATKAHGIFGSKQKCSMGFIYMQQTPAKTHSDANTSIHMQSDTSGSGCNVL